MDRHQVSLGLLFLRILGGGLLIHGRAWAWSELIHANRPLFQDFFGVGGEFTWILTVFSEFVCTLLVMLGIFTRFTAVPPLVVMLVMALAMPSGTAWSVRETYLLYALPFFVLTFTGPGEYSVDGRMAEWANPR
ncbi:MAG TPA: DoxX family protein [Candidatus Limnocylindrales bacterium]|nr:DoxX family protein [Candidatus Limnocylindrales bacterium]